MGRKVKRVLGMGLAAPMALLAMLAVLGVGSVHAQDVTPVPPLRTRWTAEAESAAVPLPEYPRPQMRREHWLNLNGMWDLALVDSRSAPPSAYPERIRVPFPIESRLSGITRRVTPDQRAWYRRSFDLPVEHHDGRWILHFGAVDWEARVWVNGILIGEHRGGYDPFSFDVTTALQRSGSQELVVAVWDPTDQGDQPRGKQVLAPHGIWYTAVTGIWQTVWLEPVPPAYIRDLRMAPDAESGSVVVLAEVEGAAEGEEVTVSISSHDRPGGSATGPVGGALTVRIDDPRLWSPGDPFLYDVDVRLASGDRIASYVGIRTATLGRDDDGAVRLLLNGDPLLHYGLLDQGWWPDGLYTAPTEAARRYDLEVTKRLGFNTVRKHVKVEPARWYFLADSLGLLVWQDMPSADNATDEARVQFARELEHMVSTLANHPSILMWVPFNEGWGQHDTEAWVERVRALDPTRLVNNASGWTDAGVGDVHDVHRYPGPGMPDRPGERAAVLGEFGGLGLPITGHTWVDEGNWGYRGFESNASLVAAYRSLLTQLRPLIGEGLAAAIYTQTTDVEVEVNGIMTYDRAVVKLPEDIARDHARLFAPPPAIVIVVPTSRETPQPWQYRTDQPAEGWQRGADGNEGWHAGMGGFGTEGTPGARVGTVWDTDSIWMRRPFTLEGDVPERLWLRIHHDEDAAVWLNGVEVAMLDGYTSGYVVVPLGDEAHAALTRGENMLAVHVTQTGGGQYADVGLVEVMEP